MERLLSNRSYRTAVIVIPLIIIAVIVLYWSYTGPKGERFAIYLTMDDVSPDKLQILSHVDIAEKPIINQNDIIKHNAYSHEVTLTPDAFERVSTLKVPVTGKSFAV